MSRLLDPIAALTLGGLLGACGGSVGGDAGSGASAGGGGRSPGSGGAGGTTCQDIAERYASAINEAKKCDPQASGQCGGKVISDRLPCGCPIFLNPENEGAIGSVQTAQQQYASQSCGSGTVCGDCSSPLSTYCAADGQCKTVWHRAGGAACRVEGLIYDHGAFDIPDPFSCNTCECVDGQLVCTEIFCPEHCPPNSVQGTQCTQCGPTDDCDVVEHACLPICSDSCDEGICVEGVCRMICG